jgi:hypothetical protein
MPVLECLGAFLRQAIVAIEAVRATGDKTPDDAVTAFQRCPYRIVSGGLRAKGNDLSHDFMAENSRWMGWPSAANGMQITSADRAGYHADENFFPLRHAMVDFAEGPRLSWSLE